MSQHASSLLADACVTPLISTSSSTFTLRGVFYPAPALPFTHSWSFTSFSACVFVTCVLFSRSFSSSAFNVQTCKWSHSAFGPRCSSRCSEVSCAVITLLWGSAYKLHMQEGLKLQETGGEDAFEVQILSHFCQLNLPLMSPSLSPESSSHSSPIFSLTL